LDFTTLGPCSSSQFTENDLEISVKNNIKKKISFSFEIDLVFYHIEQYGVAFPDRFKVPQKKFVHFILQICGLDYVRYGTEKEDKEALQFNDYEPLWCNGELFSLRLNLNIDEMTREIETIFNQKNLKIKKIISEIIAEKYSNMFDTWDQLDFAERIIFTQWFPYIFNLKHITQKSLDQYGEHILFQTWKVIVIDSFGEISFKSINEIISSRVTNILLTECIHPAEIDLLSRAIKATTFTKNKALVILPNSTPHNEFINIVSQKVGQTIDINIMYLGEVVKEIGLEHTCKKFFRVGSDYDSIASDCNALTYLSEMICQQPHINEDHWFIKNFILLSKKLPEENKSEMFYFLEKINMTLGGGVGFKNFETLKDELNKLLDKVGLQDTGKELKKLSKKDFPPGFFSFHENFKEVDLISQYFQ